MMNFYPGYVVKIGKQSNRFFITPDVNFKGIDLGEQNVDLTKNVQINQKQARENAKQWNSTLKKYLLDTLGNICTYDALKSGIRDLQENKKNQQKAATFIQELITFRSAIEKDNQSFYQNKERLHTILSS